MYIFLYKKNRHILVLGSQQILVWRYQHRLGPIIIQKKLIIFTEVFTYFSAIVFCPKLCRYSHYLYCLQEELLKLFFINQKWFFFFFSVSGMDQSYHLEGCHATGINSTSIFFYMSCVAIVLLKL